ncbi:MAG: NADPH-dependent FMN reductase [Dehalococcoidia bacterium]
MTEIAGLLGSATPPGRLASAISGALTRASEGGHSTRLFDLGAMTVGFADGRPIEQLTDDSPALVKGICGARAVILATPVYRGTLTGALKNALDLLPIEALQGKPVGIVAMGATLHHYLGAESHLRDILAWFGAVTLPTAVYLSSADFTDGVLGDKAASALDELVSAACSCSAALEGASRGPTPLAAASRPKG